MGTFSNDAAEKEKILTACAETRARPIVQLKKAH